MFVAFFQLIATDPASAAECDPLRPWVGLSQVPYEKKGWSDSDPKPEFLQEGRHRAIVQAFNQYIAVCFGAGRTQEYLAKKDEILGDLESYVSVLTEKQDVNKDTKEVQT